MMDKGIVHVDPEGGGFAMGFPFEHPEAEEGVPGDFAEADHLIGSVSGASGLTPFGIAFNAFDGKLPEREVLFKIGGGLTALLGRL